MSIAQVLFSYGFLWMVWFLIVPLLVVSFVWTCIKFFKNSITSNKELKVAVAPHQFAARDLNLIRDIESLENQRYSVLYHTDLDQIVDLAETSKDDEEMHRELRKCKLDFVVIDNHTSEVKMALTDVSKQPARYAKFMSTALNSIGAKLVKLRTDQSYESTGWKNLLTA
ncbi:hypothetical protein [Paraferrimonas sedimenticola]|uniref:DUF2726 domain-containing protein n=1 Tax=Paraferrimonas sedimenticola TaxID=375674 RepID=A0AA37RSC1_9GAMM|nr:hypothetical protein [Paraferrimonas sedimenticola]GLP95435.1 hypothetical protein GCM10007895_07410 [Paraferrimonas sedimenticola]